MVDTSPFPWSLQDPTTVELLQAPLIDADWLAKADVAVYRFEVAR